MKSNALVNLSINGVKLKVLILYSGDYFEKLGIAKTIHEELSKYEIQYFENGQVVPNPALSLINELSEFVKEKGIDFILAVGGGSVIDTAKATALGSMYEGNTWDFLPVTRKLLKRYRLELFQQWHRLALKCHQQRSYRMPSISWVSKVKLLFRNFQL